MPSFCPYARPPPSRVSVVRSLLVSIDCATQTVAGATSVAAEHRPRPEHQLPTLSPSVASQNDERPPWALLARSASRPAHICEGSVWPLSEREAREGGSYFGRPCRESGLSDGSGLYTVCGPAVTCATRGRMAAGRVLWVS